MQGNVYLCYHQYAQEASSKSVMLNSLALQCSDNYSRYNSCSTTLATGKCCRLYELWNETRTTIITKVSH